MLRGVPRVRRSNGRQRVVKQFEFFDKDLRTATDRGVKRALSKFGAFVRTRAKSSIRKRKKISEPGSPPSSHTGKLKRLIFFGYDAKNYSVVVGPVLFGSKRAPEKLEFGVAGYKARPFMRPALEKELRNAPECFRDQIRSN